MMDKDTTISALRQKSAPKISGTPAQVLKALKDTDQPGPPMTLSDEKDPPIPSRSWGFHLLVDCSHMNEKIDSADAVEEFFDALIKKLKMKKLTDFFYKKVDDETGRGLSAFQMITTSHISMHFDDAKRSGYLDIFSCKNFDPKPVVEMIKEYFKPTNIATQFIYRDAGLEKGKK
jgi:S-adenosylmethionine/arginine decarboxylase-like enzyme